MKHELREIADDYVQAALMHRSALKTLQDATKGLHAAEAALAKGFSDAGSMSPDGDTAVIKGGFLLLIKEEWFERPPGCKVSMHDIVW